MTKTKIEGFGKLKAWHLDWRHGYGYGQNFIGERGKRDGYAYGHCSVDKLRSWNRLKKLLTEPKILSANCDYFTVAGIYSKKGITYFYVDTGHKTSKNGGIYECPLSLLEEV